MPRALSTALVLSLAGTAFAASVTLRQTIAPATEPGLFSCVGLSIFGFSPCPYGLALFAALAAALLWATRMGLRPRLLWFIRGIATVGVLFSGWVAWRELCAPALAQGWAYWETFSLARVSACVWGFFVFLAVWVVVTWYLHPRLNTKAG